MANKKITQLPYNDTPTVQDIIPIVNSGTTKQISINDLTTILSGGSGSSYTSVTYQELVDRITGSTLENGSYYLITDFKTCYDQPDYYVNDNAKGVGEITYIQANNEPIVVLATSNNTISANAYQPLYPKDRIQYDWTWNATEITGGICYGRITERIDEFNNRTDYDHRNIYFVRYQSYDKNTKLTGTIYALESYPGNILVGENTLFLSEVNVGDVLLIDGYQNQGFGVKVLEVLGDTGLSIITDSTFNGVVFCGNTYSYYSSVPTNNYNEYKEVYIGQKYQEDWNTFLTFNTNGTAIHNYVGDYSNFFIEGNLSNSGFLLANNVFYSQDSNIYSNTIGDRSYNNTAKYWFLRNNISGRFYNNVIHHNGFYANIIGEYFYSNIIKSYFNDNLIENGFYNNEIYSEFYGNEINNYFEGNLICSNFHENKIGNYFNNNTISSIENNSNNNFNGNTIGYQFENNTINLQFNYNVILNEFKGNLIIGSFGSNEIDSYVSGNQFSGDTFGNSMGSYTVSNDFEGDVFGNIWTGDFAGNTTRLNFNKNSFNGQTYGNNIGNNFSNNDIKSNFTNNSVDDNFGTSINNDAQGNKIGNNFNNNSIGKFFGNNVIPDNFNYNTVGDYFQWNTISTDVRNVNFGLNYSIITGFTYTSYGNSSASPMTTQLTGVTNGLGSGAEFTIITDSGTVVDVSLTNSGKTYSINDTIIIYGSQISGSTPEDDVIITITGVSTTPSVYGNYSNQIFSRKGSEKRVSFYDENDILNIESIYSDLVYDVSYSQSLTFPLSYVSFHFNCDGSPVGNYAYTNQTVRNITELVTLFNDLGNTNQYGHWFDNNDGTIGLYTLKEIKNSICQNGILSIVIFED